MKLRELFTARDMTEGAPWRRIMEFAVPMLIGNLAQQLYNTVDSIVVGKYVGDNALGAAGFTYYYNILSGILRGMGDSFSALGFLLLTTILNIFLDVWFVASFGMGVPDGPWLPSSPRPSPRRCAW